MSDLFPVKLLSLFLFLFAFSFQGSAQNPSVTFYKTEHGLPSLETYMIKEDSQGYIWIATDRGVSRFDGNSFITYNQKDGLEDITVFALNEDNRGRMWVSTFSGKLFYFEKGRFHPFLANNVLASYLESYLIDDLVVIEDTVWISSNGLLRVESNGRIKHLEKEESQKIKITHQEINCCKTISSKSGKGSLIEYNYIKGEDTINTGKFLLKNDLEDTEKYGLLILDSGDCIISLSDEVHIIKKNGTSFRLPGSFKALNASIIKDRDGMIWLGTRYNGVYKLDPNQGFKIIGQYLSGYSITNVKQDREGGMWFTTIDAGLVYMSNPTILNINFLDLPDPGKFTDVQACGDKLFLSTYNGNLYEVKEKEGSWGTSSLNKGWIKDEINYLGCFQEKLMAKTASSVAIYSDFNNSLTTKILGSRYFAVKGNKFYVSDQGIQVYDTLFNSRSITSNYKNTLRCLEVDHLERVWLGTVNGLFYLQEDSLILFENGEVSAQARITQLDTYDKVYAATLGFGVICIDPLDMSVDYINTDDGLPSNNITALYRQPRGDLWIATLDGLSCFETKKDGKYRLKKTFSSKDGILKGEIRKITDYKGNLFVMTQEGVSIIPLKGDYLNTKKPMAYIEKILLLDQDTLKRIAETELKYDENSLAIHFGGLAYKNAFNIDYTYRLIGLDSNYRFTRETNVQYTALSPGEYTFEVKAANNDHLFSEEPASFSFIITPPPWGTLWFKILFIVFTILILFGSISVRDKIKSDRVNLQLSVLESEQKALMAQINPHFIYNAMNSIQYYLLKKEPKEATNLLGKFSVLMRKVLTNTKSPFIPLSAELSILELYLSLEKERFEMEFDYSINIDHTIDKGQLIPSMVVQPYVENAIWHGILNKKEGSGQLMISVMKEKGGIVWKIKDNGVGRHEAQKRTKYNVQLNVEYSSSGHELTKRRLELLSQKTKKMYKVEIIDLKEEESTISGTEVIIKMANYGVRV